MGNSRFLLRSRVTVNVPDARLAPLAVLHPAAADDVLFFVRYRWFNEAAWSRSGK